jgi:hypothetical protein
MKGFQVGDRVVATSPVPGLLVTSERGTVAAVDLDADSLSVSVDGGRTVTLDRDGIGPPEFGYATTVHRSQGVTVDRAHVFADGGGRELAYVAMSRARDRSQVYLVADDMVMAAEDLTREWGHERRPMWAINTGLPTTGDLTSETVAAMSPETKARVVAMAWAETGGSGDARRDALDRQLSVYRDRLDGIGRPPSRAVGIDI